MKETLNNELMLEIVNDYDRIIGKEDKIVTFVFEGGRESFYIAPL